MPAPIDQLKPISTTSCDLHSSSIFISSHRQFRPNNRFSSLTQNTILLLWPAAARKPVSAKRMPTSPQEKQNGRTVYTRKRDNLNFAVPPRGTPLPRALIRSIDFQLAICNYQLPIPLRSLSFAKIPVLFPAAFTLCSHWLTLVHNKKIFRKFPSENPPVPSTKKRPCHEPEKISALPEDERLKPENEPEKNLKIRLSFRHSPSAFFAFKNLQTFGHSNIFNVLPSKTFGHFNCSALFRFVPPKNFSSADDIFRLPTL